MCRAKQASQLLKTVTSPAYKTSLGSEGRKLGELLSKLKLFDDFDNPSGSADSFEAGMDSKDETKLKGGGDTAAAGNWRPHSYCKN